MLIDPELTYYDLRGCNEVVVLFPYESGCITLFSSQRTLLGHSHFLRDPIPISLEHTELD
jgi:hypothetical protein